MSQRKRTAGKRFLRTVFVMSFDLCLLSVGTGEAFPQMGDFLKTDRNIPSTGSIVSTTSDAWDPNALTVAPSLQNAIFDEWYHFETLAVDQLLSRLEQNYVDGLIERGLTQTVGHHCVKRLSFDSLALSQKTGYARAFLQAQKQNLHNASLRDRDTVWSQIEQFNRDVDAFFDSNIGNNAVLATSLALRRIDVALANVELAMGQRNLSNREAGARLNDRLAEGLDEIIAGIDAELNRVSRYIAAQPTSAVASDETLRQMTIAKLLRFQKAVALRLQSQCRPGKKSDLLEQAISILQPMLDAESSAANSASQRGPNTVTVDPIRGPLSVFATFETIDCLRILQQYDEAETQIGKLQNRDDLSLWQRSQLLAVGLSVAIDRRDETKTHVTLQAIETAITNGKSMGKSQQINCGMPELLLARMQAYLFYWKRNLETRSSVSHIVGTTTAPNIAACRTTVVGTLQRIERDFAPYWRHKAECIMVDEAVFFGNDPVFVELRADLSARRGDIDEAVAYYDAMAASLAVSEPREAFRIVGKAAALLTDEIDRKWQQLAELKNESTSHQAVGPTAEQLADAKTREQSLVDRLRNLAKSQPQHPDASETHRAALYHAARLLQVDAIDVDAYLSLLREHYLTWPLSKQADAVRLQAARLMLNESKFRDAIETLTAVTNRSPVALDAVVTTEQCFDRLRLREPTVNAAVENEAVLWFYRRLLNTDNAITVDWNDADAHCLLCTAKFGLLYANVIERNKASNETVDLSAAYASVEKVLQIGLAHAQSPTSQWRVTIDSMLLAVLAAQGKTDEAANLLHNLRQWKADDLTATLDRLQQIAGRSPSAKRHDLGKIRLELIEMIVQRSNADPQSSSRQHETTRLQAARADALADIGQVQAALDLMGETLRQSPGDVELLITLARILERQKDVKSRDLALRTWQTVEQRSHSRSESWWEAKEAAIRLLIASGKPEQRRQAEAMLEMLLILNPDLDGPERKLRLETLIKQKP